MLRKSLVLTIFLILITSLSSIAMAQTGAVEVNNQALNYYMEGMRLEMAGEYDSAARAYARAVQADSSSATLFFALARAQLRIGQVQDGERALEMVIRLDSTNTDALKMLAELAGAKNESDRAVAYLRKILSQDPENQYALSDLAEHYRAMGDTLKEAETLERIYEVNPRAIHALGRAEQIYLNAKEFEKALALYNKLLRNMPDNTELIERELRLLVALERIPEADAFIDSVLAKHPEDGEFIALKGKYLGNVKGSEAAIHYLEHAVTNSKTDWEPRSMLGQLYFESKAFEKAIPHLQTALEGNPAQPAAVSFLALSHLNLEQPREAYKLLVNYIPAFPDNFFLHYLLGSVARDLGTQSNNTDLLEEALLELSRAIELRPDDNQSLHVYATTADQLGKTRKAMDAYERILKSAPEDDLAMNNYAYMICENMTDVDSLLYAAKLIQKAIAMTPDNPSYLDTAGWVYFKLGHLRAAREMLERSLVKDPTNPEVLNHMAELLETMGQDEAAARYRQEAQQSE
ncbi:MAG: tetratricopeptide repeat protein [Candidatus Marinimicrobia bacterium]|nr:tetratricopeptide repeat protein [Candidatus Neomarinimicrobiota bacterium]MCF7839993.1 tetratricopeptide repeat protein [Candidatus Neomarinimicrobiota bacterium]MCF7902488.1 tetratricopeptide repeat protein [Candidatus Neomarinimicrobiota bacterium]